MDYSPVIILALVFVLIAVRQVGGLRVKIWQAMLLGAVLTLLIGDITPANALKAINPDVMLFLFGMFVVGAALVRSGYLERVSGRFFGSSRSPDALVLLVLFVMGLLSSFLMNDTIAIIGTPLVLTLSYRFKIGHKLMLITLCFAVTLGSVASPIGNPQNLLIAINGEVHNPFVTFFKYLFIPTILNLFLAYLVLKFFYKSEFKGVAEGVEERDVPLDSHLALLSKVSLTLLVLLISAKVIAVSLSTGFDFKLAYIALIPAIPILAFSPSRVKIVKDVDWATLVFFASMFVLMESVWESGALQAAITGFGKSAGETDFILVSSVLLSQVLSNVPFVALYLPLVDGASVEGMMALASGSTIAGNLLILGAASNIIIIQNAERRGHTVTFLEFAKIGIPLTAVNVIVYRIFLSLMG